MNERTCSVEGCENSPRGGRGFCVKHYSRWYKYGDPLHLRKLRGATPAEQLDYYVVPLGDEECWLWSGCIDSQGYGQIHKKPAHRLSYEVRVGAIPDGGVIDHICHNRDPHCVGGKKCLHRRCTNPAHLEVVSLQENSRRVRARRSHCMNGHEFTEENTFFDKNGGRDCRTCIRDRGTRARQRERVRRAQRDM